MLNIFVTATDSNIGKTFITAGLAATMQSLGYQTCVYKPVQTGIIEKQGFAQAPDLAFVKNIDPYIKTATSYMLKEKTTPYIAAEMEKIIIDKSVIKEDYKSFSQDYDCIITEGSGGVMTPVAPNFLMSDLIKTLALPTILIIKPTAGTVNHTLLSINELEQKGINLRGVIINDYPSIEISTDAKTAPRLIEEYTNAKILGIVQHFENIKKINPNDLITHILNGIDIESVFDVTIAKLEA